MLKGQSKPESGSESQWGPERDRERASKSQREPVRDIISTLSNIQYHTNLIQYTISHQPYPISNIHQPYPGQSSPLAGASPPQGTRTPGPPTSRQCSRTFQGQYGQYGYKRQKDKYFVDKDGTVKTVKGQVHRKMTIGNNRNRKTEGQTNCKGQNCSHLLAALILAPCKRSRETTCK